MIERSLVVKEEDLTNYLRQNWRGFDTKDYELLAAVLLCRLHRQKLGEEFYIGLPVLLETEKNIPNEYNYKNIERILKAYIKEDTPIDIFLVSENGMTEWSLQKHGKNRVKGMAFQIKKVGSYLDGDITTSTLGFLKEIPRRYAPIDAALLLVVGGGKTKGSINLKVMREKFNPKKFPFTKVLYLSGTKEKMTFGELWPNFGRDEYPINEFFYV